MTSSRAGHPARTTGAHRAPRSAHQRVGSRKGGPAPRPSPRHEPHLDGLFTYCLSVLCDHDAAAVALAEVLVLAERRRARGPAAEAERRAWLYALARWTCLRRLAEVRNGPPAEKKKRQGSRIPGRHRAAPPTADAVTADATATGATATGATSVDAMSADAGTARATTAPDPPPSDPTGAGPAPGPAPGPGSAPGSAPGSGAGSGAAPSAGARAVARAGGTVRARHRELALLAWPEAAGATPEQREALELAVRHQLTAHEVAAVLGLDTGRTRDLLASAACEVERTRTALAVARSGSCPGASGLAEDDRVLLDPDRRGRLVRHVDDCPRCRRAAERARPDAWPGTSVTPAALPILTAPRPEVRAAMAHAPRARRGAPRFDRRGFPLAPQEHTDRRERLRARAVTTTVVATVVAAPVLALWTTRDQPRSADGAPTTASEVERIGGTGAEQAPDTPSDRGDPGPAGKTAGAGNTPTTADPPGSPARVSAEVVTPEGVVPGADRLGVAVRSRGGATTLVLTALGDAPVHWSATVHAHWLRLSRTSGTLAPGDTVVLRVHLDPRAEPPGSWTARISLHPAGAFVLVRGHGAVPRPPASGTPGPSGPTDGSDTSGGGPTPGPSPSPTATHSSPPPDPGTSAPSEPGTGTGAPGTPGGTDGTGGDPSGGTGRPPAGDGGPEG
ncbi:hypothetical protein [Streptomyces sp. NPDC005955]|uniref:BACON domain-containing protein n=1 Tax=Streptomyces sp. NPDC005955 TaxID=3364738 RepID=UPI0036947465